MNRIEKKFSELKELKKKAFIAYITAGDPTLAMTERLILALDKSGADIVELGVPFSDPLADGPTIQAASQRALKGDANLKKIFKLVSLVRKKSRIPLIFMTYYNPVLKYGLTRFSKSCARCGVDGVIIPDLPYEEARDLISSSRASGIDVIFLTAPTSTPDRIRHISKASRGFIYYVSLTGVTGARERLPSEIVSHVRTIKSITDKPVAVGFGISNAGQAGQIAKAADGVIVGSAIVKIIGEKRNVVSRVSNFAKILAMAIHNV